MTQTSKRSFSQNPKDPAFYNNPYALYSRLHAISGPVFWEDYGFWCLTGFDTVTTALKDRRFSRLPPQGMEKEALPDHLRNFEDSERYSLLQQEPPDHTRLRKSVNRAFVSRSVLSMESEIRNLANRCIDEFEHLGEVDLLTAYATPIPVTIIARLLGVPDQHCDDLRAWSNAIVRMYTMTQTIEEEHAADTAAKHFIELLRELLEERRLCPANDLLSHLIALQEPPEALSDEQIISTAILLLNAGHEATVHQIGNTVHTLLRQSTPPQSYFKDVSAGEATINEAMRYDAPLHMFTRYAQEDIELHPEVTIARGDEIALLLGAANRDPSHFDNADQFDPGRVDAGYTTLGAGIHFCVGAALAKLEMRIALTTLFERLPGIQLAEEPIYQDSYHFHGLQKLIVKW
ncbi:hypothetical protein AB833_28705 [Chromatiales bacterium (ex Bugula neritina AB1)]|nr:hypothetical protein AB833_28705 [Chromatiales bacterium (ex Bugula neritina AB1)]